VTARRNRRTLASLALFLAFELCPRAALANGAFPAVSQLLADPSDDQHLVLRSNFGLLISHDRGKNWDLLCEAGVGYQNLEPAIALLADGSTIAALPMVATRSPAVAWTEFGAPAPRSLPSSECLARSCDV
jgi:hypothetical protein